MRKTTIKELGPNLPIGILEKGKLKKEFVLRPYKTKTDRLLDSWRVSNTEKPLTYLTAKYVSMMIERVGDIPFPLNDDGNSSIEQEFKIHNWYFADVLYSFIYSRIMSVGSKLEIPWACPNRTSDGSQACSGHGIAQADLWTTEVNVIEDIKELENWVNLKQGFKLKGGQLCKKLKMKPISFQAQLSMSAAMSDMHSVGYHHFMDAISGVDCVKDRYVLSMDEIDEISKRDALMIDRQALKFMAGVDLRTHLECTVCGTKIINALNWTFDHFFDYSIPLEALTP